ncbi:MAG: response regulator [Phycisphaerae bacterium]|nr:response regulator [Phycisphaerae bacterium]
MSNETILIVDDEEDILELVRYNLARERFQVICASTGEDALAIVKSNLPDLIVLDLMLPGINGLDICRKLKADPRTAGISIIMLTARGEESDIVTGLELGADDYLTKPFSPRVLLARIRASLRRLGSSANGEEEGGIRIGELVIIPSRHEVLVSGESIQLTYTEFKTLYALARRPGRVFTRYQIVDAIRGEEYIVTDRSVDVQIVSLRKKLGVCGSYIETVRGVGYRFKD